MGAGAPGRRLIVCQRGERVGGRRWMGGEWAV